MDTGSIRIWELNWHWNADGFDARSRRPAWLKNMLAGLHPAGFSMEFAMVRSSPQRFDCVLSIVV